MKQVAGETCFCEPTTVFFQGCPPVRVKISSRVGPVRFCISPSRGLVITVPRGYDLDRLPRLVLSRREWICRHWEKFCIQGNLDAKISSANSRPEREKIRLAWPGCMDFAFTGEHFGVRYEPGNSPCSARENLGIVTIRHVRGDWSSARDALESFLKRHAKRVFAPVVHQLAEEKGLPPAARVCVRFQRTRWGSCSSAGNINLNVCLLFLPREQAEYVFLHELCHREHMNHSPCFWKLLETVLPEAQRLDKELAHAWAYVPRWLLYS